MSYSSMIVLVSPKNDITVCFPQSECNLHSTLAEVSAAAKANLILVKVPSESNTKPHGPSTRAHKRRRFALEGHVEKTPVAVGRGYLLR